MQIHKKQTDAGLPDGGHGIIKKENKSENRDRTAVNGNPGGGENYPLLDDFDSLCDEYAPLLDSLARQFAGRAQAGGLCCGCDYDDLRQEACIALSDAADKFDRTQSGVTFGLYAKICITNRLISVLRSCRRRSDAEITEIFAAENKFSSGDPLDGVIEREGYSALLDKIKEILTDYEQSVFDLYIRGLSYRSIARRLSVNEKSVDNALSRIRSKVRAYLKTE